MHSKTPARSPSKHPEPPSSSSYCRAAQSSSHKPVAQRQAALEKTKCSTSQLKLDISEAPEPGEKQPKASRFALAKPSRKGCTPAGKETGHLHLDPGLWHRNAPPAIPIQAQSRRDQLWRCCSKGQARQLGVITVPSNDRHRDDPLNCHLL